jgi:hypothetical protein
VDRKKAKLFTDIFGTPTPTPTPIHCGAVLVSNSTSPILQGKTGTVGGFLGLADRRLCLVQWPSGGWTFMAEDALTQIK